MFKFIARIFSHIEKVVPELGPSVHYKDRQQLPIHENSKMPNFNFSVGIAIMMGNNFPSFYFYF
jgi:hypothetical protein